MSTGLYTHRTRNAGEIVRDTLYNPAHKNHQTNDVPNEAGALSDDLAAFQATQDPAPGGVVNQVISILDEFQQLRFALADIKTALNGGVPLAEWYTPVSVPGTSRVGLGARVYRSALQAISFKTSTAIVFDTSRYDTGVTDPGVDPFWVVGSPTRLTAKAAGLYQFNGFVQLASGGAGAVALFVRLNGTKILASSEWITDGSQAPQLAVDCQYLCALNDYVELVVFQTAANPLNALTAEFGLELLNPTAVIPPPTQHTLMITESGTGSGIVTSDTGGINCPGVCSASYSDGVMVVLTPAASTGAFVQWSGDVPIGHETDNPLTVTMDQARTIDALFTAYTLSISEAGTGSGIVTSDVGGINCPGTCSAQYGPGTNVQLTATPTAGAFVGWSGDLTSTSNPDSITMNADKTVTATFTLTGTLFSYAAGGSANILGTRYINPASQMSINATLGIVEFKLPIDVTLTDLSVTMAAALAGGHTIDFRFTIGGVDDGTIITSLVATDIEGADSGAIVVTAGTSIAVKAVQSGGGGDNIQSLSIVFVPA